MRSSATDCGINANAKRPQFSTRYKALVAFIVMVTATGCTGRKHSSEDLTIRGALTVPPEAQSGVMLIGVSAQPFDQLAGDPMNSTLKYIASTDFSQYEIKIPADQVQNVAELQIFGLIHRDPGLQKLPKLTKNDLVGFYVKDTHVGLSIVDRSSQTLHADLTINRVYTDRKVQIPIEIADPANGNFIAGVYCDEITGLSAKQLNLGNVAYVKSVQKTAPVQGLTLDFPLFQVKPSDYCYLFAFRDDNGNQILDPGEAFGFYADPKNNLPTQINLSEPATSPLRLTLNRTMQAPSPQPISIKGSLAIAPDLRAAMKRFFVVAVRQKDTTFSLEQVTANVLAFTTVDPAAPDFELDLTNSGAVPGDRVTAFALGDPHEHGLPALANGDGLGLAIQDNTLVSKAVQYGTNPGFNIDMKQRYYDGSATVAVDIDSDYRGPMVLLAYAGPMSLDAKAIDTSKVVGFATFKKSEQKAKTDITLFSLGQNWPLDVYIIGLLDANDNQKPDPGESLQLPLDASGAPVKLTVKNGDHLSTTLNYLYTLQIPSNQNITLSGKFAFTSQVNAPYVHILVAQGESLDAIMADPIKYVKAAQKVPTAAGRYQISLANTSLKVGEKVFIIGLTSNGSGDFPQRDANTLGGVYMQGTSVGYVLKAGDNPGLDMVIDRTEYKDKIAVTGTVKSPYQGPVLAMLYAGNAIDLVSQSINPSAFIAMQQFTKSTDMFTVNFTTLLSNQQLPVQAIPFLFEDANGNGRPDPGERVWYAFDPKINGPLSLTINAGTVANITFDHARIIPDAYGAPLSLSGSVSLSGGGGDGHLYVLVLDGDLPSLAGDQLTDHVHMVQEVKPGPFTLDLSSTALRPGAKVLVLGLFDRSAAPGGFPQVANNDLIGIYRGQGALAQVLRAGDNPGFDLNINRRVFDGQAQINGRIVGPSGDNVFVAAYTGDLTSLTDINLDLDKLVGFTKIQGGTDALFQLTVNPLGQPFPINAYIVAFTDTNGNHSLDPGETLYFYSTRADKVPEKVTITQGQALNIDLNQRFTMQVPGGQAMPLSGSIVWQGADLQSQEPAYLFVANAAGGLDALRHDPLHAIKYLRKLNGRPTNFAVSLESTDLKPGDNVMVGVLVDKDGSLSPTPGDRIGIALKGLSSLTLTLSATGLDNLTINVNQTIYSTQKTLDISFAGSAYSNYQGRVLALLYTGATTGLSMDDMDPSKVAGFADFTKDANRTMFSLSLLPTAQLPITNATLIALLDTNGNGQPDPGEIIGFSSAKAGGFPAPISINANSTATLSINSFYRLPKPSGIAMTAKARVDSSMPMDTTKSPVVVALLAEAPQAALTRDPLSYLKNFTILKDGATDFSFDLSKTDLKPGDRVTAIAFDYPVGSNIPPTQLDEGAQVGILLNNNTLDYTYTLAAGDNALDANGSTLQINRIFYQHDGTVTLSIDGGTVLTAGDPLNIAAYQIDTSSNNIFTIMAQLTSIDYTKIVGFGKVTYQGKQNYTFPILPALAPGLVNSKTRKIDSIAVVAFRDTNNNGKLDSGEPSAIYAETPFAPFSLLSLALAPNNLTGTMSFTAGGPTAGLVNPFAPAAGGH